MSQNPSQNGMSRLGSAVPVLKPLWRPNATASSRKVKEILSFRSAVSWCFTFEARLLSWWSVDGEGGRSSKCQQPSVTNRNCNDDDVTFSNHCQSTSNMMFTEVSFIDFVFLYHSFWTRIRSNNFNHQEEPHHSRRGAPTKAQHRGSKEMQCTSKNYSVQDPKID